MGHKLQSMRHYEVTFIVDPVLSNEDIHSTARNYEEHIKQECEIVHVDEMGLRQLAYPMNKRTSGVYYCIEFKTGSEDIISRMELALRRDERVMRFLTVKLDKYGVKFNDDKRNGLIGKKRREEEAAAQAEAQTEAAATDEAKTETAAATEAPVAVETAAAEEAPATVEAAATTEAPAAVETPAVEETPVAESVAAAVATEVATEVAEEAAPAATAENEEE